MRWSKATRRSSNVSSQHEPAAVEPTVVEPEVHPRYEALRFSISDNALLTARVEKIERILTEPHAVLLEIHEMVEGDETLLERLRRGALKTNADVFLTLYSLERLDGGREYENDPVNTIRKYLNGEFQNRQIPWPKTPEEWCWLLGA